MPSALRDRIRRRLPVLHAGVREWYWSARALGDRWLGTRFQEWIWSRRGLEDIQKGLGAEHQPHRRFLMKQFSRLGEIASLLEVGSGFGPNLLLLAQRFPRASLAGADINPISVRVGREVLSRRGVANVQLVVARADRLDAFADHSREVVLTDALLLYVGPDKIEQVIAELSRVAGRALVLVEQHGDHRAEDPYGLGTYHDGRWLRNYVDLLHHTLRGASVSVTKMPEEVWSDPYWQRYGHIIWAVV